MTRMCAYGLCENTGDKLICTTRARHGNTERVLPVECAPCVATAEKELKLLVCRNRFGLREVHKPVEGELDLVTKFVGTSDDSVKGFANLCERGDEPFARNGKRKRLHTVAHLRTSL